MHAQRTEIATIPRTPRRGKGQRVIARVVAVVAVSALLGACAEEEQGLPQDRLVTEQQPLEAYCMANVIGHGMVPTETEYLPRVIRCENGAADLEALKAQAVSARGYLYYRMSTAGEINDGTSDQVFGCNGDPSPIHYQAVAETAGIYLEYNNTIVAPFYVAGAIPGNRTTCVAASGDNDYSNTERYVTYNQGQSGANVTQTTLGWVNSGNWANRGCKSQNGAHCLAEAGWEYQDILKYYYGTDIGIEQATGACVSPVDPPTCGTMIGAEATIDDADACFTNSCRLGNSWREETSGNEGHLFWTFAWDQPVDCTGTWSLDFASGGQYEVEVYLTDIGNMTVQAPYTIRHNGAETPIVISQEGAAGWVSLGTFEFAAGGDQWIALHDETGEPYVGDTGPRIVWDAVKVTQTSIMPPMDPGADMGMDMTPADMGIDIPTSDTTDMSTPDTNPGPDGTIGDIPGSDTGNNEEVLNRTQTAGGCACTTTERPTSPLTPFAGIVLLLATIGVGRLRRQRSRA